MTAGSNGPFQSERQARAAALAVIPPEDGWSILRTPQCRQLLEQACAAAGVELGDYDRRVIGWLAGFEDSACMAVAGLIARAARRPDGTVTEWGVTLEGYGNEPFAAAADEGDARQYAAGFPRSKTEVVRREVTPWTPAPGEGEDDGNR